MPRLPNGLTFELAPAQINSSAPTAVVLLHGRGSDEKDLLELASVFDSSWLAVSIRAPFQFQFGGYTWFDWEQVMNGDTDQVEESCQLLIRAITDIQEQYHCDPNKIALFGFSMGAMMALTVALTIPHRIRAVVAHSGTLLENLDYKWNDIRNTSFFLAHGSYDPIVPISFGRQAFDIIRLHTSSVVFKQYPIQHSISDESLSDAVDFLQKAFKV